MTVIIMMNKTTYLTKSSPLPAFEELTSESYNQIVALFDEMRKQNILLTAKIFSASSERLRQRIEQNGTPLLPGMEDLVHPLQDGQQDSEEKPNEEGGKPGRPSNQRKPRKGGRIPLPEDLEKEVREHYPDGLTKAEIDADPDLTIVGKEVSLTLAVRPPVFYVIKDIRYKVARRSKPEKGVQIADCPAKPIEKGKADASLLAWVIVEKFLYHQPLNRQEQRFKRLRIRLARSTLCDWVLACAEMFMPIVTRIEEALLKSKFLHTDDTPVVQILEGGGSRKSRIWVYAGGPVCPYVLFKFAPTWRKEHVETYLGRYSGYVQCDAYKGYDALFIEKADELFEIGCWSHARRYAHRASMVGERGAWIGIELIGHLFGVEREAKRRGLKGEERKAFRLRFAPGLLSDIRDWLDTYASVALPQSLMGKAYTYIDNQWDALQCYLEDGDFELTNNYAERLLRMVAMGRVNWQFFAAESGGIAAAVFYTIVRSCQLNEIDPWLYITDVLNRLENYGADELLPDRWKARFLKEAEAKYRVKISQPEQPASAE